MLTSASGKAALIRLEISSAFIAMVVEPCPALSGHIGGQPCFVGRPQVRYRYGPIAVHCQTGAAHAANANRWNSGLFRGLQQVGGRGLDDLDDIPALILAEQPGMQR